MKGVNLLPQYRRQAKAQKARLMKWVTVLGGFVMLLLVSYLTTVRYAAADTRPLDHEGRALAARLEAGNKTTIALSQELRSAQQKLRAAQAIGQQPDWSLLLSLLSQATDENILLNLCRLERAPAPAAVAKLQAAEGSASPVMPLVLELNGIAKAQSNVSEYVLRLEKSGLFDEVKLVKTSRQDFMNRDSIAFCLECTFGKHEGKTP